MIYREVAWRVFAGELNSSDLEVRGEGEKAPSYLITPLGAQINRLFAKANEQGHTMVPLRIYFKAGKAKIVIALVKGKREFDKRESIRKREQEREMDRARKRA